MYKVYIENCAVVFAQPGETEPQSEWTQITSEERPCITKLLQKLQFTKQLYVISENSDRIFEEFCASMPFIEAGGGLTVNESKEILMIYRNNRWDLPKGKLEPNERIEDCAVREVCEECALKIDDFVRGELITHTFHAYRIRGLWVLKQTSWFHMNYTGNQCPQPQTIEGITQAEWIPREKISDLLQDTYYTIGDVFRAAGYLLH